MATKRIFQLGLEPQYMAHLMMEWNEGKYKGDIRIRRAKSAGLIVAEIEDGDLFLELSNKIRIPHVNVKDVEV